MQNKITIHLSNDLHSHKKYYEIAEKRKIKVQSISHI